MKSLNSIAVQFYDVFQENVWSGNIPELSELSISDAYQVQALVAEQRIQAGEKVVGYKVGCTSRAIRAQFGLAEPISGRLFDLQTKAEGVCLDWTAYANCAIEPEMVIKIGNDIIGEDLSNEALVKSIEYVSPGIEIHNFTFWLGEPTMQELICTGGIHAGLVIGADRVSPKELLFCDEVFSVFKDNNIITSAPASEIMGGPLDSLRWLAGFLRANGDYLRKGSLVIPGSPTELVEIDQDTELKVMIENVGEVVARFSHK